MFRIRQFLTLTRLTAVEAIRQPVCLLLTASCVLCTAITPLAIIHKFGEEGKLARDSGLAFHFVFGLLVAGYSASNSLARESRTGTLSAILSKPVRRETLFLAKFTGIACVLLLFSACMTPATLLCERVDQTFVYGPEVVGYITDWQTGWLLAATPLGALLVAGIANYARHRPFASTAFIALLVGILFVFVVSGFFNRRGELAPFDYRVDWRILPASILVTLALLVLAALAAGLSTRCATPATLAIAVILFFAGLMSDYLLGRYAEQIPALAVLFRFVPNWQHFWVTDALGGEGRIPWTYVGRAASYATTYCAAILFLGTVSFRHVETQG